MRRRGEECLDEILRDDRTQIYEAGLDGLIVSEKEVRSQRIKLKPKSGTSIDIPIAPFNRNAKIFVVAMCFNIDLVTPSSTDIGSYQIVKEWSVGRDPNGKLEVLGAVTANDKKPRQIYKRVGNIFTD